MYEIHVSLFGLVTFYTVEVCETILFIAAVCFVTFLGLRHLWNLYQQIVAAERFLGAGRHED